LTKVRISAALRRGGRKRGVDQLAARLHEALRWPQPRQARRVEEALGAQAVRLLATLDTECASVTQLGEATAEAFAQHPDYQIITSFTGLGDLTGARVLAEIGDDRARFADARSLKAYAGSAPVTRASGRSLSVTHRRVKNNRLAAALRNVFNRLIGCLYHCLQTGHAYDETTAFTAPPEQATVPAAA
jgi:transposase